jgi:DNA repair protein RAD5
MSFAHSEGPPAKKRRFFTDSDDDVFNPPSHSPGNENPSTETISQPNPEIPPPINSTKVPILPTAVKSDATVTFDKDAFQALVGDTVDSEAMSVIAAKCGDSLERAVNMYFDGTWKNYRTVSHPLMRSTPQSTSSPSTPLTKTPPKNGVITRTSPKVLSSRYIGAFGVEGWATRSGANLLTHGDVVKIERHKVQQTPSRLRLAAAGKGDVLVRFTDTQGREIGRLAKDAANWISSLIDQNVCRFEGTCVYAPDRLRTNDTIFLQLRCFLKTSLFRSSSFDLSDNRSTGLYEEKESPEERDLRLRQVAIVRLFQEINLTPTAVNSASANSARQRLLEAAELAEKKSKLQANR